MAEGAGDHAAGAGRDRRAGADGQNRRAAVDAALGDGDRNLGANLGVSLLEPGDWSRGVTLWRVGLGKRLPGAGASSEGIEQEGTEGTEGTVF